MAELRLERIEMEISSLAASQEHMLKEMREMFAAMNAKFDSLLASQTLEYREHAFNQYKNGGRRSKNCSRKRLSDAFIGVNTGTNLSNMPSPTQVVALLKSQQIPHVRLYDADHAMLMALANTGIRVIVSIPNNELLGVGQSNVNAANWVARNVVAQVPATNINAIAIGSEVPTSLLNAALVLVSALQFIHSALAAANLDSHIKVSTPHSPTIILD
ncbi:glucan endo-1,3-beta-glucosidase 3 isoform X1 [Cinnamomum micranthum f. kanehirae]|uniref:Glucan endo-1,3-beta-glucosidase 3 isoform X1 n=1 Tax=Cinnamomum micranthum f. kanehirae TaxID=337451 RepID=A0A3S3MEF9_9MAGN|nr:glucan endo-1,3-beta-glucosidase 3 isoform X1 [Cinnamomum micranthum f. kanehirae]